MRRYLSGDQSGAPLKENADAALHRAISFYQQLQVPLLSINPNATSYH